MNHPQAYSSQVGNSPVSIDGPVSVEAAKLYGLTEILLGDLDRLHEKLSPILSDVPPSEPMANKEGPASCRLHASLIKTSEQLSCALNYINTMIGIVKL